MALSLLAANNAQTVLAAGISSTATSLTVNAGTGTLFPSPVAGTSFFKLTIIDAATGSLTEIVHVTARNGDVFTIQRGQEGTVPRSWSANDIVANMMTAGTLSYILGSFQPLDPTLTALAALVGVANKLPYFNGDDTAALTDLTQVGRDIIGKTDIAAVLQYLGLGDLVDALIKTNNLSDLPDKALSRGNLGVPKGVDAQMVQARVHFNGHSGAIISGFNISSITKLGTGRYTVNFTTPLPNANYTATSSAWNTGGSIVSLARIAGVDSRTATNFGVSCMDNTSDEYADSSNIDVIVVGGV
ncbi:hypothetical protein [Escherichia coli]|uniref:hypothetical protein n=1 Tax=Escherichia coli TaxID=562 RepID=UPI00345B8D93